MPTLYLDLINENDYCLHMEHTMPKRVQAPAGEVKHVTSEALLGARKELVIVHNGREYRLRLTQNGKLILTA